MRRDGVILGALLLCAQAGFAAKTVSIAEFEKRLDKLRGKPDNLVAEQMADFELSERATSARLGQWLSAFPGKKEQLALIALADSSAFYALPAADAAPAKPPTEDQQEAILARASAYLKTVMPRLPDLLATRDTLRFDDSATGEKTLYSLGPSDYLTGADPERVMHVVGRQSLKVSYVHGAEHLNDKDPAQLKLAASGLTTWGEFGPILSVVFGDSGSNAFTWLRWEQEGSQTPLAVFAYKVPRDRSHYLVSIKPRIDPQYPAYGGEIAIYADTGRIARVTMLAELASHDPASKGAAASADIAVEYAEVPLGDRTYNCPVHGVAISRDARRDERGKPLTQVNDVEFTNYHLFRGDMRIIPETPAGP